MREIVLTVHVTMDDRYEEACIADAVLDALAAADLWDTKVDAVVADGHVAWGRHLTELVACPHCTATVDHPLGRSWTCTNDWHHLGDRHRRELRRAAIRGEVAVDA